MTDGIYTLANDKVYDQLVALLNSIEANAGANYPVCVIAYNDDVEKVRAEVDRRNNVTLLDDPALFKTWEDFSYDVWSAHPTALETWKAQGIQTRFYRVGENHRYCAFDAGAPFDRFIYLDADTLVLGSLAPFFEGLDEHDFVVYDFQFKDPGHIFNMGSAKLNTVFPQERISKEIFCSGCYASKRGIFSEAQLSQVIERLKQGDADILYLGAPNQSVLNYMVMSNHLKVLNLAFSLPSDRITGNSVTSTHFQPQGNLLFDKGAPLTYLHYIGISSKHFRDLCAGKNVSFPYRDVFLHYRYRHAPETRPNFKGPLVDYKPKKASLQKRILKKLGLVK
jgi:lipopolysaccharide biosynthesis glycosyltransferase